jgi:hypothetical protein
VLNALWPSAPIAEKPSVTDAGWNAAGILTAVSATTTTKHIPAFGNPFRVSDGLRSEVLRRKVRESSQRFGARQARSGTQAHMVDGLGSGEPGAFRYEWAFPLLLPRLCPWPLSSPYSPSITRAFVLIRPICS